MLEDCHDLLQCEIKLSWALEQVSLIEQVALSQADQEHLTALICRHISLNPSKGISFLITKAPACLACFLVGMGTVGYNNGNYWTAVAETLDLVPDPNWERKLGESFLELLREHNLPTFDLPDGLRYVTPILIHGGIPNSCLSEYFLSVVSPLVRRDLLNPTDPKEIAQELLVLREADAKRVQAEEQYQSFLEQTSIEQQRERLKWLQYCVDAYDEILTLWQLEDKLESFRVPPDLSDLAELPDDYESFQQQSQNELNRLDEQINAIKNLRVDLEQTIACYTPSDQDIAAQAETIGAAGDEYAMICQQRELLARLQSEENDLLQQLNEQSTTIFSLPWNHAYGPLLVGLPFEHLEETIISLTAATTRQRDALSRLSLITHTTKRTFWWWISPACILFAFAVVLSGLVAQGAASWLWWPMAGLYYGLALLLGFMGWRHQRNHKNTEQHVQELKQMIASTTAEQQSARTRIDELLGSLPIEPEQLESPSSTLLQQLHRLAILYNQHETVLAEIASRQDALAQGAEKLSRLATTVGIASAQTSDDLIQILQSQLQTAKEREAAAADAWQRIQTEVDPELSRLIAAQCELQNKRAHIADLTAALGQNESIAEIVAKVRMHQELQETIRRKRSALSGQYGDLRKVERLIAATVRQGKEKVHLQAAIRHSMAQLAEVEAEAKKLQQELAYYPAAFSRVDEPIRRYLLHGGKPAEGFLIHSVQLYHQVSLGAAIPAPSDVGLPERVLDRFTQWWQGHVQAASEEQELVQEQSLMPFGRFRAPVVTLDLAATEVTVRCSLQQLSADIATQDVAFVIGGDVSNAQRQIFPLRIYRSTNDLVETEQLEVALLAPADQYEFTLLSGDRLLRRWVITGLNKERPFLAFDGRSGKLIGNMELPAAKVWLALPRDFSITPAHCVLEQAPLAGAWKGYTLRAVDLKDVSTVEFSRRGRSISVPVVSAEMTTELVAGQLVAHVTTEGIAVYTGSAPRIRIGMRSIAELPLWRLSISSSAVGGVDDRHYRLSELDQALQIESSQQVVEVLLEHETLLGSGSMGTFTVRVRKPPFEDWRETFCLIPHLALTFDRSIYLPYEPGKAPLVQAKLCLPPESQFTPISDAEFLDLGDHNFDVRVDGSEDTIRGVLSLPSPSRAGQPIPLAISIPKLRWRITGPEGDQYGGWHNQVEELWLGDWETVVEVFLLIAFPEPFEGDVRLSLDNSQTVAPWKGLLHGKAKYDLLALRDVLRNGPSLRTLCLTLPGSAQKTIPAPLFHVRTRWEVEEVECVQESQGHTIVLSVKWIEKGKTENKERKLRLWRLAASTTEPVVEQVIDDVTSTTIKVNARSLPPGPYILHFALEDPWSTTHPSRPALRAPNTQVIAISSAGDIRQGETFTIRTIYDDADHAHGLGGRTYRISILGKIINRQLPTSASAEEIVVTRDNEGWYVGKLEVEGDPAFIVETEDGNPVKFQYDANKDQLTAIEDKYGEGAMYCQRCKKLFWSQATNQSEELMEHPLVGPIEVFNIAWET